MSHFKFRPVPVILEGGVGGGNLKSRKTLRVEGSSLEWRDRDET